MDVPLAAAKVLAAARLPRPNSRVQQVADADSSRKRSVGILQQFASGLLTIVKGSEVDNVVSSLGQEAL